VLVLGLVVAPALFVVGLVHARGLSFATGLALVATLALGSGGLALTARLLRRTRFP
jgi:hypothetical protein